MELTGALAGLTLALQNTRLIALSALITGIAAALSMAASEYLSKETEDNVKNPITPSLYTGIAYIVTVFLLVIPYFIFANYYIALVVTITISILIILAFNYYIAIAKNLNFKKRFLEMAFLSLGVATVSFFVGYFIRAILGVEI